MKKTVLIIIAALAVTVQATHAQGILFEAGTWQEALDKAKTENKLLFVDVWATWCGPCKKLASSVFPQETVGQFFNEHFVCFKMQTDITDKETRDLYQQLSNKYNIGALPTLLWVTGEGKLEHFFVGFLEADKLIEEGKKAINPELHNSHVISNWANQPHTLENGLIYFEQNKDDTDSFDDFFMSLPDKQKCDERLNMLLYTRVTMPANSKTLQYMAANRDSLSKIYPTAKQWEAQIVSQVRRLCSVAPIGSEDSIASYFLSYDIQDVKISADDYYCMKLFRYGRYDEAFAYARQMMKNYGDTDLSFVSDLVDVAYFCAARQQAEFTNKQKRDLLKWTERHVSRKPNNDYHNNFVLLEVSAINKDAKRAEHYVNLLKPKDANSKRASELQLYEEILQSIKHIK